MDCVTEDQRSPICDWYGTLEPEVQAEFDLLVKTLSETPDWTQPKRKRKYKELTRQHAGLCELLLKVGKRKFRPIGIVFHQNRRFIFLGGCEKVGHGLTDPEGAFDSALRLKERFEERRGAIRDYPV